MTDVQGARVLAARETALTGYDARGVDTDARLVAEARRDRVRFVGLYERYFEPVHRYVRMRVGDRAASEDVTSEVFVTALANHRSGPWQRQLFRLVVPDRAELGA